MPRHFDLTPPWGLRLAKTLKYLWPLFGIRKLCFGDKWVLSTKVRPIVIDAQTV